MTRFNLWNGDSTGPPSADDATTFSRPLPARENASSDVRGRFRPWLFRAGVEGGSTCMFDLRGRVASTKKVSSSSSSPRKMKACAYLDSDPLSVTAATVSVSFLATSCAFRCRTRISWKPSCTRRAVSENHSVGSDSMDDSRIGGRRCSRARTEANKVSRMARYGGAAAQEGPIARVRDMLREKERGGRLCRTGTGHARVAKIALDEVDGVLAVEAGQVEVVLQGEASRAVVADKT